MEKKQASCAEPAPGEGSSRRAWWKSRSLPRPPSAAGVGEKALQNTIVSATAHGRFWQQTLIFLSNRKITGFHFCERERECSWVCAFKGYKLSPPSLGVLVHVSDTWVAYLSFSFQGSSAAQWFPNLGEVWFAKCNEGIYQLLQQRLCGQEIWRQVPTLDECMALIRLRCHWWVLTRGSWHVQATRQMAALPTSSCSLLCICWNIFNFQNFWKYQLFGLHLEKMENRMMIECLI